MIFCPSNSLEVGKSFAARFVIDLCAKHFVIMSLAIGTRHINLFHPVPFWLKISLDSSFSAPRVCPIGALSSDCSRPVFVEQWRSYLFGMVGSSRSTKRMHVVVATILVGAQGLGAHGHQHQPPVLRVQPSLRSGVPGVVQAGHLRPRIRPPSPARRSDFFRTSTACRVR